MPSITPATSRAIGPTVSSEGASGHTPSSGMRPQVVLRPAVPQHADGLRIEPAVSLPSARSTSPSASATALPLELPPGMHAGSNGLTGVPKCAVHARAAARQLVEVGLADDGDVGGPQPGQAGGVALGRLGLAGEHRARGRGGRAGHVDEVLDGHPGPRAGRVHPQDPRGAHPTGDVRAS